MQGQNARCETKSSYGGRAYLCLSPQWISGDRKSQHPVMYWLNPADQDKNNAGWFTVEELDQWIAGTGPVVNSKTSRK